MSQERTRRTLTLAGTLAAALLATALAAAPARGATTVVHLGFDDGTAGHAVAAEILARHALKATFYVNSARIGTAPAYLTQAQLRRIAALGHEVAGHTLNHLDVARLEGEALVEQICADRDRLVAWGFQPASFAYPFGSFDAEAQAVVRSCGYTNARTVGGLSCRSCPRAEGHRPRDPYAIMTPDSIKRGTTLADMQRMVTDAEAAGGGIVSLVFHLVCDGPSCDDLSVSADTLSAFAAWVKAREGRNTVVRTMDEALRCPADQASPSALGPCSIAAAPGPLDSVRVFPNPWRAGVHAGRAVVIDGLPASGEVRLFTISGRRVRTLRPTAGTASWDLHDEDGRRAASGLYLYLVTDGGSERQRGLLGVIR